MKGGTVMALSRSFLAIAVAAIVALAGLILFS
jgi:hypothetical protein